MQSDTTHIVNLEVTVPRIVFATPQNRSEQREVSSIQQENEVEETEQVRLLPIPLGRQQTTASQQRREQQVSSSESSVHMIHSMRFRMFSMKVPASPFLLQVLRRYWHNHTRNPAKENEQLYVADTSAFTVEFRHQAEPAGTTSVGQLPGSLLLPGFNHVVIHLDDEGMPSSYSIDGAES